MSAYLFFYFEKKCLPTHTTHISISMTKKYITPSFIPRMYVFEVANPTVRTAYNIKNKNAYNIKK